MKRSEREKRWKFHLHFLLHVDFFWGFRFVLLFFWFFCKRKKIGNWNYPFGNGAERSASDRKSDTKNKISIEQIECVQRWMHILFAIVSIQCQMWQFLAHNSRMATSEWRMTAMKIAANALNYHRNHENGISFCHCYGPSQSQLGCRSNKMNFRASDTEHWLRIVCFFSLHVVFETKLKIETKVEIGSSTLPDPIGDHFPCTFGYAWRTLRALKMGQIDFSMKLKKNVAKGKCGSNNNRKCVDERMK